jgi:hypothetical protein
MTKAAQKPETIGEFELSGEIRKEIKGYNDPENLRPTAAIIYQQIEDTVRDGSTVLPFEAVMDHIRRLYGMSRPDFLKKYKRVQRAFDAATKEREQRLLLRDKRNN